MHSFMAFTSLPNGEPEGHTFNDAASKDFFITTDIPQISELFEGFEGDVFPPDGWTVNPVSIAQWGITPLVHLDGGNSLARSNYNDLFENEFTFELPEINISGGHNTELKFDYAYAIYPGYNGDSLQVTFSLDCGETWQTLFNKGGVSLRTTNSTYEMFMPDSPDQWKHESFSLSEYEGDMLIRFTSVNGQSNNLYIDNIGVDMLTGINENNVIADITVFPNPFTSSITLTYPLELSSQVNIRMYDSYGRLVAEPVNEYQQKGEQNAVWQAENLPSGVYFIRLKTDKLVEVRKVIKQ